MVGLPKDFSVQCVSGDSGVLVKMDSQNFMEITLFLGEKGEEQLGIIFNCFVGLAT
jgi:hypothetical protein